MYTGQLVLLCSDLRAVADNTVRAAEIYHQGTAEEVKTKIEEADALCALVNGFLQRLKASAR